MIAQACLQSQDLVLQVAAFLLSDINLSTNSSGGSIAIGSIEASGAGAAAVQFQGVFTPIADALPGMDAGNITILATGNIQTDAIHAYGGGGAGAYCCISRGGAGGAGGNVLISSSLGSIVLNGDVNVSGGGGAGGNITLVTTVNGGITTNGPLLSAGGGGGAGTDEEINRDNAIFRQGGASFGGGVAAVMEEEVVAAVFLVLVVQVMELRILLFQEDLTLLPLVDKELVAPATIYFSLILHRHPSIKIIQAENLVLGAIVRTLLPRLAPAI